MLQYHVYGKERGLRSSNVTEMVKENKDTMMAWTKGMSPTINIHIVIHDLIYLYMLETGHDGASGTGFRSLTEPFDHPAFVRAVGETFAAGSVTKSQLERGEFSVTLGQMAFAVYKVTI